VIKKENEILELLKQGVLINHVSKMLGINFYTVKKVAKKYADQIPEKKRATRYSFRLRPDLDTKFLAEIHERGITPTQLLNEMAGDWYGNKN
jgi:hypothetical protein